MRAGGHRAAARGRAGRRRAISSTSVKAGQYRRTAGDRDRRRAGRHRRGRARAWPPATRSWSTASSALTERRARKIDTAPARPRRPPRKRLSARHEHLRTVHPPADRHGADDAGPAGVRRRVLHPAARRVAARRRLPDHHRLRATCPAPARRPWRVSRHAARAAVRRHPRPGLDELDQRPRQPGSRCSSLSTAASTARRPTCRRRSMPPAACCPRTCPTRRPTARSTRPTGRC